MASDAKNECLSSSRNHDALPEVFPVYHILHLPNVMNLERSFFCLTVFALLRIDPSDQF
jgi:hypothetical protein